MRQYENYKETGIEWLNNVPSHWEKVRLRYLCDVTTGNRDTVNREENGEFPFYVRSKTIERISTYAYEGEAILTAGDGDICKIWHHVNEKFDFHQRVYMLYNFKRVHGRFLYYYISENFYYDVFKLSAKNTVDSLRLPMFHNFPVLVPPIEEQINISNYLDQQTRVIDQLLREKEKLILLLKEKRQSIINESVTKGLNPNVQMKDSGVEWLGKIPLNWELVRLRYLGKCQNGVSQGGDYFGSGDPFVNYSDVYKNDVLPITVNGLAKSTPADKENYSVQEGDVFFTRTSETIDEIGLSSTCLTTIENAVFAGFLIRFRPNMGKLFKGYSRYFFRSLVPRVHFVREMNLVTRASLSQELLKSLPVCLPTIQEQKEIASFLDGKINHIDEAITKIHLSWEKLIEYRKSIISETVSGKVDVREWGFNSKTKVI
jgi:type I restriction enzyme, S subunit